MKNGTCLQKEHKCDLSSSPSMLDNTGIYWKPFRNLKIPFVTIDVVGIPRYEYFGFLTGQISIDIVQTAMS